MLNTIAAVLVASLASAACAADMQAISDAKP